MRRIGFAKDLRVLTRPHSRADAGYGSDQPEMASREQLGRDTPAVNGTSGAPSRHYRRAGHDYQPWRMRTQARGHSVITTF
jgi:hypothetical protein